MKKIFSIFVLMNLLLSASAHAVVLSCERVKSSETFVIDTVKKQMFGVYGNKNVSIDEQSTAYIVTGGFYKGEYPVTITISRMDGAATAAINFGSTATSNDSYRCKVAPDKPAF